MSKLSLLLRGSALQSIEAIVSIVAGFITLPLMLNHLGESLYGIWVLIGGFTALLYIFDLGFATSVTRGVAGSIAIKNTEKTNRIISSALVVYSGLAGVILLIVILIATFYRPQISDVISPIEFKSIILIVGLAIAIEFPFKAFAGITNAHLRYDLVAIYRIIIRASNTAILIYLLLNGYGLLEIAILQFFTSIVSNLFFLYMAKSVYKEMIISPRLVSKETITELFHYSAWAFVIDINRLLKERIDLFFIGGFISLSAVAIYYIPVRLVEYSLQLLYKALNLSLPILAGDHGRKDDKSFYDNLLLMNRVYTYFSTFTLIFFILWGETIIYHWMGAQFSYEQAYIILLLLLLGRLAALCSNGFNSALYARAQHKLLAWFNIWETIATALLLTVLLVWLDLGPLAATMAVAAPLVISRALLLPSMAIRHMEINHGARLLMLSYRPILLVSIALVVQFFWPLEAPISWQHLINSGIVLLTVIAYLYFELMAREKGYIARLLKHKIKA